MRGKEHSSAAARAHNVGPATCRTPINNEVYVVAADGTGTFFRFAYARATGGYSQFGYQPICAVSPDGRSIAWSSNVDQSLGRGKVGTYVPGKALPRGGRADCRAPD